MLCDRHSGYIRQFSNGLLISVGAASVCGLFPVRQRRRRIPHALAPIDRQWRQAHQRRSQSHPEPMPAAVTAVTPLIGMVRPLRTDDWKPDAASMIGAIGAFPRLLSQRDVHNKRPPEGGLSANRKL